MATTRNCILNIEYLLKIEMFIKDDKVSSTIRIPVLLGNLIQKYSGQICKIICCPIFYSLSYCLHVVSNHSSFLSSVRPSTYPSIHLYFHASICSVFFHSISQFPILPSLRPNRSKNYSGGKILTVHSFLTEHRLLYYLTHQSKSNHICSCDEIFHFG